MDPSNDLRLWEFELLYRVIDDHIQHAHPPAKHSEAGAYGFLADLINSDPKVAAYIKQRAATSANKHPELSDSVFATKMEEVYTGGSPYQKVKLKQDTRNILFLFLGCKDLNEFKAKYLRTVSYSGKYFSQSKGKICEFTLELKIPPLFPNAISLMVIEAEVTGFHDGKFGFKLNGDLVPADRSWIGTLRAHDEETGLELKEFLQLSIYTRQDIADPAKLTAFNQLFGSVQTISINGHLISVECVLLRDHAGSDLRAPMEIDRYLHIRRNYFGIYIDNNDCESLHALRIAETQLSSIRHYSNKTYRIVAQLANGSYNQARFTIGEDYTARIVLPRSPNQPNATNSPNDETEELRCWISLDNVQASRLMVYSYAYNQRYRMHTATAIEFHHRFDAQHAVLRGTYCVVDSAADSGLSYNQFVMLVDDSPFEVKKWVSADAHLWKTDAVRDRCIALLKGVS
jgi:hypothetical protein